MKKIIPIFAIALIMSGCTTVSTDSISKPIEAQESATSLASEESISEVEQEAETLSDEELDIRSNDFLEESDEAGSQSTIQASAVSFSSYDELIEKIRTEINKKIAGEEYDLTDIAFTRIIGFINVTDIGRLGYKMMDIDGDGVDELMLGEGDPEDEPGAWDSIIYDMYTIKDGKVCRVLKGWDRNRYYLCGDGVIRNEGASGAAIGEWMFYRYNKGELELIEGVAWDTGVNTYYKNGQEACVVKDSEDDSIVSEYDASFDKHKYRKIDYIPFVER